MTLRDIVDALRRHPHGDPASASTDALVEAEAVLLELSTAAMLALSQIQAELHRRTLQLDHPAHEYGVEALAQQRRSDIAGAKRPPHARGCGIEARGCVSYCPAAAWEREHP